ncbi:LEAF RUST 10 DISEASE-RESISTANCE LOCUS RECEPTOR-LIKE PROTEIN KINASE-like 1.5 [Cocos nucifera]|uniref:LEAF RUST 10 DISEASE-RESISTANCE LOCUS RECEPTOR-LIKE PROTEIN KINASE-like 1.5 n=1 Tax=Cocos nucifera TaxID=13894 RepID=A0A8K0N3Z2_COCNU|nr:LEAF RUST 10 DISEASE-RESISTANCE LOCUS RECEPTOR-LIKE PROTEIN KINASE-like 1.5 [Cocos nucifera]
MTLNLPTTFLLLTTIFLLLHTTPSSSDFACKSSCGSLAVHYPFGTGAGCGSPAFQPHVTCDSYQQTLTLTTHTGSYPIQAIDYTNQVLYITDPSMSTCSSTNTSDGFSLDWNAPFTFLDGNIFALLDCSTSSSPLYSSNTTDVPLCDTSNAPICSLLYSCPAISLLNAPISTCCIYAPVSLGPSFEMDLNKLQCSSYSGIYSFNGAETNPSGWKFGIALKYRFSVDDGYPSACADCEKSNGVCGYTGQYNSFTCYCANGMNSSTNCYFASASWNGGSRTVPLWIGIGLISSWGLVVAWIL